MNMIQKRQQMKGQSGFTLIELLVAIAILGILAGVAVFAVGGLTDSAKETSCVTEKETVETAIDAFKAIDDNNEYPTNLAALTPDFMKTDVSTNWTYVRTPAAAGPPVVVESYTLDTEVVNGDYKTAC
jgi:prepilin-type N-terminal cleavage/methylation domain-containing protein